jgi:hypothetical protein
MTDQKIEEKKAAPKPAFDWSCMGCILSVVFLLGSPLVLILALPVWVFPSLGGSPLDRANVEKAFKRALKAGGLPSHFTPHCLRHTFASLLLQDGVSPVYVREQLGHCSIKLTVDTYGRWLRKKAPGAVDRLDDTPAALGGNKTVANGALPERSSREVIEGVGGPRGDRTPDLLIANQALSQLS